MTAKFQKNTQTLDFDSDVQCKGSHGKDNLRDIGCFPIQTHTTTTVLPGYCTIRFFLSGSLKTRIEWKESNEEDELYEVVDEILTGLSIETVFVEWMNRLQRLIDGNGDYVS
jgi:hypothetical protein